MKLDLSPAPRARLGRWSCTLLLALLLTACDESNTQADAADNRVIAAVRHGDGSIQAASSLNVGEQLLLQAPAGGGETAAYQWYRNGEPIDGATAASYELGQVSSIDDQAQFSVRISTAANPAGLLSQVLTLSVAPTTGLDLLAGSLGGPGNSDGLGAAARFSEPRSLSRDAAGNLYVLDGDTNRQSIRKISPTGQVTTLVGTPKPLDLFSGNHTEPALRWMYQISSDAAGNVYTTDHYTIFKITPAGQISMLAGQQYSLGQIDGHGTAASFRFISRLSCDAAGNIYALDGAALRKISPGGEVTTLAGQADVRGSSDGSGKAARFDSPQGLVVDGDGNVYIADNGDTNSGSKASLRKVTPDGQVSTLTQVSQQIAAALRNTSYGLADIGLDGSGNLYLYAWLETPQLPPDALILLKISQAGVVSKLADSGLPGSAAYPGAGQLTLYTTGAAVDASGNVYVADSRNTTINKIATNGKKTRIAGSSGQDENSHRDGSGRDARFYFPHQIATDGQGNTYVAGGDHTIRKIAANGVTTTLAGKVYESGNTDGSGSSARFNAPGAMVTDSTGNLYVADSGNYAIRKITPTGVVSTLAGSSEGSNDGKGTAASFGYLRSLAIDPAGNLYTLQAYGNIRKITPDGVVSTRAAGQEFAGTTLAVDSRGNFYTTATMANQLLKLTPNGEIIAIAGNGISNSNCLGLAIPQAITLDADDNLYVADSLNHTICKVTPAGVVSTFAGKAGVSGVLLGALPGGLNQPVSVAVGKRHGRPTLFVLNQQWGSRLRDKTPSDGISIALPVPPYRQSELNVVTVPLP
jgi:sugar lactone lactonase YvrE